MKANVFVTRYIQGKAIQTQSTASFAMDAETENRIVNIHPDVRYQALHGFGGTFTEATGYCLNQAGEALADEIIKAYFGKDGLCYTQGRVHLDSCDASLSNYSAMEDPKDTELHSFSLKRDKEYLIPWIKRAQAEAGRPLSLMVSPWSPPPFMKTNGEKNNGGKLKPEYRALWAKYMCRFILEYRKQGIDFAMLSLQNEPKAVQIWDSCIWTAEEEREFLREYLLPEMRKQGLSDMEVLIWDHNKERALERTQTILCDDEMRQAVAGTAVHWYSGTHFEQLAMLRQLYPEKRIVFNEGCVEYRIFDKGNYLRSARMYAREIIGNLNGGADAFIHWSLVFNPEGGPNHVSNFCEGVVFCDAKNQKITYTLPYYYIGHFSRYIQPGAVRIGFSRFTEDLDVTAFQNPNGERVVVLLNKTDEDMEIVLRETDAHCCPLIIPGDSIVTVVYGGEKG